MRNNREIINEKSINIFGHKENVCASDTLIDKALDNESDMYINLAYTDYGGSVLDKYLITYLIEQKNQGIVYENTSWNGMNALVFGKTAKEIKQHIDKEYVLGYEGFETYYCQKEWECQEEEANNYIKENEISEDKHSIVYGFFHGCTVGTFGVDYCEIDLEKLLN